MTCRFAGVQARRKISSKILTYVTTVYGGVRESGKRLVREMLTVQDCQSGCITVASSRTVGQSPWDYRQEHVVPDARGTFNSPKFSLASGVNIAVTMSASRAAVQTLRASTKPAAATWLRATTASADSVQLHRRAPLPPAVRATQPRRRTMVRRRCLSSLATLNGVEGSEARDGEGGGAVVPTSGSVQATVETAETSTKVEQAGQQNTKRPVRRRVPRERPPPITLTDRAASHLVKLLASKPGKVGVRLGVKRRGCNGMSYTMKYADEKPKGDEEVVVQVAGGGGAERAADASAGVAMAQQHVEQPPEGSATVAGTEDEVGVAGNRARLFVDPMATLYIAGTVMDWEETELSSEFTFRNPNAKGECGCGESFNV